MIYIQETLTERKAFDEIWDYKLSVFYESPVYETYHKTISSLFRTCQKEYGRCEVSLYIDTPQGTKRIGWVFLKRAKYDDSHQTYLQETWVTLHDKPPTKTIEYHYLKGF